MMTPDWTLTLPFGISRCWDVLIGPIGSTITILLVTSKWIGKVDYLFGLFFGLFFGLVIPGLALGLASGVVSVLTFGLTYGLVTLIYWLASQAFGKL